MRSLLVVAVVVLAGCNGGGGDRIADAARGFFNARAPYPVSVAPADPDQRDPFDELTLAAVSTELGLGSAPAEHLVRLASDPSVPRLEGWRLVLAAAAPDAAARLEVPTDIVGTLERTASGSDPGDLLAAAGLVARAPSGLIEPSLRTQVLSQFAATWCASGGPEVEPSLGGLLDATNIVALAAEVGQSCPRSLEDFAPGLGEVARRELATPAPSDWPRLRAASVLRQAGLIDGQASPASLGDLIETDGFPWLVETADLGSMRDLADLLSRAGVQLDDRARRAIERRVQDGPAIATKDAVATLLAADVIGTVEGESARRRFVGDVVVEDLDPPDRLPLALAAGQPPPAGAVADYANAQGDPLGAATLLWMASTRGTDVCLATRSWSPEDIDAAFGGAAGQTNPIVLRRQAALYAVLKSCAVPEVSFADPGNIADAAAVVARSLAGTAPSAQRTLFLFTAMQGWCAVDGAGAAQFLATMDGVETDVDASDIQQLHAAVMLARMIDRESC